MITFYINEKERERDLAEAFLAEMPGRIVRKEADVIEPGTSVACMVGVKSRKLWGAHREAGIPCIMFDKGYDRSRGPNRVWEFWRIAVNAHHPTEFLTTARMPPDRSRQMGMLAKRWRAKGSHILLAGSSAKYHEFYGLPHPTEWAEMTIEKMRQFTDREIIYRPKPSWREATKIAGATYSKPGRAGIDVDLADAWALVTHGSNACYEAIQWGVPCIILGNGVAKPISSSRLEVIERPLLARSRSVNQWLANLAYCQWTLAELTRGEAGPVVRKMLETRG
jgi:hypothetical protein